MEDTSLTNEVCTKQNCVVSAGSYLYVFGEPPETRKYVVKAERYDTVVKKWEEIADMLEETGDAFGEATKDKNLRRWRKHRDKNSVLQNCEVYNISTNERLSSRSLIVSRMRGT